MMPQPVPRANTPAALLPRPKTFDILARYWALPDHLARHWWAALVHARWSVAVAWRMQLCLYQSTHLGSAQRTFCTAQFLTLCRASNLAEALRLSSPWQGSSPAQTRALRSLLVPMATIFDLRHTAIN